MIILFVAHKSPRAITLCLQEAFTTDGPGSLLDLLLNSNVTKALNAEGTIPLVDVDNLKQTLRNYFAGNYSLEWKETFENIDNIIKQVKKTS